jgi:hypothetical protein
MTNTQNGTKKPSLASVVAVFAAKAESARDDMEFDEREVVRQKAAVAAGKGNADHVAFWNSCLDEDRARWFLWVQAWRVASGSSNVSFPPRTGKE